MEYSTRITKKQRITFWKHRKFFNLIIRCFTVLQK